MRKNKKGNWIMIDELGGKIIAKFVELRAIDEGNEDKKAKCTKKCVIKRKLKFENYEKKQLRPIIK